MKRLFMRIPVLMLLLLCLATGAWTAAAQQSPPQPAVQADCPYVLKSGVPFAWLRYQPSSFSGFGFTLRPNVTVSLNDPPVMGWDGVQWWIYVWPNASPGKGYYWVELDLLEPRCPSPTPPPGTGAAVWASGSIVRVRLNVPFVWFRSAPAPGNPPVYTVFPGTQLVIVQGATEDSFNQWWWLMRDPRNGFSGWVEQNTVELVSGGDAVTPVPSSGWQVGDTVRVGANVPYSWIRYTPSSYSDVAFVVVKGRELSLLEVRQNDGVQNWWKVILPNTTISGWVEENSLEFVRRGS